MIILRFSFPRKNTRFQYKLIKRVDVLLNLKNAIEWLCLSGIVSQVYRVEQIKKPFENYRDIDAFKIYVSDLGAALRQEGFWLQTIFSIWWRN